MKYVIIGAALLFMAATAKADYQSASVDLTGSWKEVHRTSGGAAPQVFADTTYYDFMSGNEYAAQQKGRLMRRGTYKANAGTIDLGEHMYKVLEISPARLLLKDDGGTYEFIRYDRPAPVSDK